MKHAPAFRGQTKAHDAAEFAARLARECPSVSISCIGDHVVRLMKNAHRYKLTCEMYCNGSMDDTEFEELANHYAEPIKTMIAHLGLKVEFQNDPRGATVKLILPSGYTDDFGGTGFCVPGS